MSRTSKRSRAMDSKNEPATLSRAKRDIKMFVYFKGDVIIKSLGDEAIDQIHLVFFRSYQIRKRRHINKSEHIKCVRHIVRITCQLEHDRRAGKIARCCQAGIDVTATRPYAETMMHKDAHAIDSDVFHTLILHYVISGVPTNIKIDELVEEFAECESGS